MSPPFYVTVQQVWQVTITPGLPPGPAFTTSAQHRGIIPSAPACWRVYISTTEPTFLPEITLEEAIRKTAGADVHFIGRMNGWDALPSDAWASLWPMWPQITVLALNHNNGVNPSVIRQLLQDCPRLDVLDVYSCSCTIADVVEILVGVGHAQLQAVYAGNKMHDVPLLWELQLPRLHEKCPLLNTLPVFYNGSGLTTCSVPKRDGERLALRAAVTGSCLGTQGWPERCMYS